MDYFNEQGHLTKEAFVLLEEQNADELTRLEISEHLSFCDMCLDDYLAYMSDDILIEPEKPMKNIVYAQIKMKLLGLIFNKYSSVAIAAGLTIMFMLSGFLTPVDYHESREKLIKVESTTQKFSQVTTDVTSFVSNFFGDIFDIGGRSTNNEKK